MAKKKVCNECVMHNSHIVYQFIFVCLFRERDVDVFSETLAFKGDKILLITILPVVYVKTHR